MEAPMPPPRASGTAPAAAARAAGAARPSHARTLWSSRLGSGLRAALACAIIGSTASYGPPALRRRVAFSAFSYVSAVLIAGEATLGEALHGVACAAYASVPGVLLGAAIMSPVGPGGLSVGARTLAVVFCSSVVALLEFLPLLARRLALGQIILIYVAPLTLHGERSAVWQPVHVAASAALGVAASLLALLLPYPRLACREVSKKSRLFADAASERLGLLVNAFCADNSAFAVASISRARLLSETGDKLLQSIKMNQAAMERENTCRRFSPISPLQAPAERLQAIDTLLTGMDLALSSVPSFPVKVVVDGELRDLLLEQENHIRSRTLQHVDDDQRAAAKETALPPQRSTTLGDFLVTRPPTGSEDLPPLFFLFCMKLLGDQPTPAHPAPEHLPDNRVAPARPDSSSPSQREELPTGTTNKMRTTISIRTPVRLSIGTLTAALKCSLSMGLAVYLGLLFSKDNGYWSGLAVAVVMTPWREATFKLANARAQGTALGTVYGVLGALVSRDLMWLRILVLLPWIVFTSFLRRSRMYGHAGGICAALSAIMVLGRRYGAASDAFAITRLTETCIGLSCSIVVELLLQPTRASSLARRQLSECIAELREYCMDSVELTSLDHLSWEKGRAMGGRVDRLEKTIGEADGEPNFWFLPFPTARYNRLQSSLRKMAELVLFMGHGLESLKRELYYPPGFEYWNEARELINEDMESFKKVVGSSLQHCLEDVNRHRKIVKTGAEKAGAVEIMSCSDDLEMGERPAPNPCPYCVVRADHEEDPDKILASFLRHAEDAVERVPGGELQGACRSRMVLCMAAVGFCMRGLLREAQEARKAAMELAERENPPAQVGGVLYDNISGTGKT